MHNCVRQLERELAHIMSVKRLTTIIFDILTTKQIFVRESPAAFKGFHEMYCCSDFAYIPRIVGR